MFFRDDRHVMGPLRVCAFGRRQGRQPGMTLAWVQGCAMERAFWGRSANWQARHGLSAAGASRCQGIKGMHQLCCSAGALGQCSYVHSRPAARSSRCACCVLIAAGSSACYYGGWCALMQPLQHHHACGTPGQAYGGRGRGPDIDAQVGCTCAAVCLTDCLRRQR